MRLLIVTPVLDDWPSCNELIARLDRAELPGVERLRVLIVNDGSTTPLPANMFVPMGAGRIAQVDMLDLACNVGHQRAIALGIAAVARSGSDEHVLVMDCDGEDDPADVPRLVAALQGAPLSIVVATRARRSESLAFRVGYVAYQALFRAIVGRSLRFGNFSTFGPAAAARLARMPEVWNHLAASVLRSRLPITKIDTHRGARFAGKSTMNGPALVTHGLSAFAVFSDAVFARLLLLASGLGLIAALGIVIVVAIRLGTNLAIPGWATMTVGGLAMLLMQAILISLVASVQLLATRSQPGAVPIALISTYVRRELTLVPPRTEPERAV